MRTFFRDLGYALRLTLRRPGLTLVTVATLALGIGGTSAIFAVMNALLLRPMPVSHPDRLVRIFGEQDGRPYDVASYPNLRDLAAQARLLDQVAIHQQTTSAYGLDDATETANIELVSGNYFSMLGVAVTTGRAIAPADDAEGDPRLVAVVSHAWWRTRLGQSGSAVGETIFLNGSPFTVIGIAPPSFRGSHDALATDVWVPLMAYDTVRPRGLPITRRGWGWLSATARLAPGATVATARAEVDTIAATLESAYRENAGLKFTLVPATALPEELGPTASRVLYFALLVAALALTAACANVANAQLATVFDRRREIAIRLAMGASRRRIVRQWLTESLLVALAAAGIGAIGALWLRDGLSLVAPPAGYDNFAVDAAIDWRVLVFAAIVVGTVTMLFGGLPALRAAHVGIAGPLQEDSTSTVGGRRRSWSQAMLVAGQIAVSVALVASSLLLGRSLAASRAFDLGFDTANLVIATPNLANLGLDATRGRLYYRDTLERIRRLPGVTDATVAAVVPLGDGDESMSVAIDGYQPPDGRPGVTIANNFVWPNYFDSMRIPIRRGRGFVEADGFDQAPVVAVINEAMAARYWPSRDPLGDRIRIRGNMPVEIVGIAANTVYAAAGEPPRPQLFLPFGPVYFPYGLSFHVRAAAADQPLFRALRRELRSFDPRVQATAGTFEDLRQQSLYPGRMLATVSSGFGLVALLLAVAGIYGVMAHVVATRRREFAVRLALGARPGALVAAIVGQGLRWTLAGVTVGIALAVGLARLLTAFLFGVTAADLPSLAGAALLLVAVSALAAYAPARRVLGIDPARMLRQ